MATATATSGSAKVSLQGDRTAKEGVVAEGRLVQNGIRRGKDCLFNPSASLPAVDIHRASVQSGGGVAACSNGQRISLPILRSRRIAQGHRHAKIPLSFQPGALFPLVPLALVDEDRTRSFLSEERGAGHTGGQNIPM